MSEKVLLNVTQNGETVTLNVTTAARGRDAHTSVTNENVNAAIEDNPGATRTSLELGDSATHNVGTTAGTVAAGDDGRFHAAVTVSGNGLTLSGQQLSLSIGTGSTQVAAGNHTHLSSAITDASTGGNGAADEGKLAKFGPLGYLAGSYSISALPSDPLLDASYAGGIVAGTESESSFVVLGNGSGEAKVKANKVTDERVYELPDASGDLMISPIVVSSSRTALIGQHHLNVATATYTDPSPAEGAWFSVIVRNGTATVGGIAYSVKGTEVYRSYHSGSWSNDVYDSIDSAATLSNKTLSNPTVTNYTESVVSIGNSGTSQTLSLSNGTLQSCTLTGNCTFTMPTATAGKSFTLLLNTGAGGFTGTFTGVKWPANVAPTITATASRRDIISFVADGTAWYGSIAQNYTP